MHICKEAERAAPYGRQASRIRSYFRDALFAVHVFLFEATGKSIIVSMIDLVNDLLALKVPLKVHIASLLANFLY